MNGTIHNPDRFMIDLRQILALGRKRIGILVGAGAPYSVRVDGDGKITPGGDPLIPDVAGVTTRVLEALAGNDKAVVDKLLPELGANPNIEVILTKIRRLSLAIGNGEFQGLNGQGYHELAERICKKIGAIVSAELPLGVNPFSELVSWIGGTQRAYPLEIFTPNYDLLIEEAFERARLPYFDGFTGAHKPFFDPASIADDDLPPRWSRLWKIHGSLGWEITDDAIIRTGNRKASGLIYPDHLKYDHIARQPFSALFERLRDFLKTPDTILMCSGFSFFDAHIVAVIDEALSANQHTAVLAFQHGKLAADSPATQMALRRPNFSLYARDAAVIFGVTGAWQPGQPSKEWQNIRRTYWGVNEATGKGEFLLGDFAVLARFFALAQASAFAPEEKAALADVAGIAAPGDKATAAAEDAHA